MKKHLITFGKNILAAIFTSYLLYLFNYADQIKWAEFIQSINYWLLVAMLIVIIYAIQWLTNRKWTKK